MNTGTKTASARARERLDHPVIDGDGHMIEYLPLFLEYLREVGGQKMVDNYVARLPVSNSNMDGGMERVGGPNGWFGLTEQQRHDMRVTHPGFWGLTTKTLDRATVMLPKLFRERFDDLGIDFAVVYGSMINHFVRETDSELRLAGCRALNKMYADLYGSHGDRMVVGAVIPAFTPQEAIDELEYAAKTLGFKAAVFGVLVRRPIAHVARTAPQVAEYATWLDVLAISSEFDYDPLWSKCVELGIPLVCHTGSKGMGFRASPTSWLNNHMGHFAAANEAFCKALILGGVAERFPKLNVAFLEGGVAWACNLYNQSIEYWEKRNIETMRKLVDPALLDRQKLNELLVTYGEGKFKTGNGTPISAVSQVQPSLEDMDSYRGLNVDRGEKFKQWFDNFFFGCEADDRLVTLAFNPKLLHYGTKLQAIFGSDVAHFDVPDITTVVAEAHELVEDDLLTPEDFRAFTFGNAVKLYTKMRPDFFKGTAVEREALPS